MIDQGVAVFHNAALTSLCEQTLQYGQSWSDRAPMAAQNRRLPSDTFKELFAGGWLDLLSPRAPTAKANRWPTMVECARIASRACASTGWMIALVGGHGCIVRRLPLTEQRRLYVNSHNQLFASASCCADSQLTLEDSGMRVHGRWRFSSGIEDATWLMLNAPCTTHVDKTRTSRFLVFAATDEVEPVNSWDSFGMAATGSHDVLTHHLLIPHDRVFALHDLFAERPSSHHSDYIDHVPLVPYLTTSIIGPLLGCAEGALAAYMASISESPMATDARIVEQVAHSSAQLHSATLLYDSLITALHEAGIKDCPFNAQQLSRLQRDRAYLAHQCVQAVGRLIKRLGASSLVAGNPLQRHWRDIQTIAAHRDLAWNEAMSKINTQHN